MSEKKAMKLSAWTGLAATLSVSLILSFSSGGCKEKDMKMRLKVTHRMYATFSEIHKVRLAERFGIGDQDYSAEAVEFIPDFVMDTKTGQISSRSTKPNNPAVKILVFKGEERVDSVWAFPGAGVPHFSRKSLLAFQLLGFSGARQKTAPASPDTSTQVK